MPALTLQSGVCAPRPRPALELGLRGSAGGGTRQPACVSSVRACARAPAGRAAGGRGSAGGVKLGPAGALAERGLAAEAQVLRRPSSRARRPQRAPLVRSASCGAPVGRRGRQRAPACCWGDLWMAASGAAVCLQSYLVRDWEAPQPELPGEDSVRWDGALCERLSFSLSVFGEVVTWARRSER